MGTSGSVINAAARLTIAVFAFGAYRRSASRRAHRQWPRRKGKLSKVASGAVALESADRVKLGDMMISSLGVGAMNWPLDKERDDPDAQGVVMKSLERGVDFFDTAEAYGFGKNERLTADCLSKVPDAKGMVATKFAPVPWRTKAEDVVQACRDSCERLGVKSLDLYMIHFPDLIQPLKMFGIEERKDAIFLDGLAQCYKLGLAKNVGVSNYGPQMLQQAFDTLAAQGIPLASNEFNYSLFYRSQGSQMTLDKCQELGVTALAYFPLCMGLLTGKYDAQNLPGGLKGLTMKKYLEGNDTIPKGGMTPLVEALRSMAARKGKSPSQVALNWIICKGAVPIPGARTAQQAEDNAGALGWRLTDDEVVELEAVSDGLGFEFSGGGFKLDN